METAYVLMMYLAGLLPFGLAKLFSLFLYASHRQAAAAKIATVSLLLNIIASLLLIKPLGAMGLALAGSIGGWVLFILTVREVGINRFWEITKTIRTLYWIVCMAGSFLIFYFINLWLIGLIR